MKCGFQRRRCATLITIGGARAERTRNRRKAASPSAQPRQGLNARFCSAPAGTDEMGGLDKKTVIAKFATTAPKIIFHHRYNFSTIAHFAKIKKDGLRNIIVKNPLYAKFAYTAMDIKKEVSK